MPAYGLIKGPTPANSMCFVSATMLILFNNAQLTPDVVVAPKREITMSSGGSQACNRRLRSVRIITRVNLTSICKYIGHLDERTTYKSYIYDKSEEDERLGLINNALSV